MDYKVLELEQSLKSLESKIISANVYLGIDGIIEEKVTAQRVKEWFEDIVHGEVKRYELPRIGALNFVMDKALGRGVTR